MGVKGSFATTRPSKIVLNIDRKAVKANPKKILQVKLAFLNNK